MFGEWCGKDMILKRESRNNISIENLSNIMSNGASYRAWLTVRFIRDIIFASINYSIVSGCDLQNGQRRLGCEVISVFLVAL